MKKILAKILFLFVIAEVFFTIAPLSFAGVKMEDTGLSTLSTVSTNLTSGSNSLEKIQNGGLKVLHTAKVILSFLAVIYVVYIGIRMVVAMGDEKEIATEKRQLVYTLLAFLFINIPGEIYALFAQKEISSVTSNPTSDFTRSVTTGSNIFVNLTNWNSTVENGVLSFVRVAIVGIAIFMFALAAFELITSAGTEEKIKQAKDRFTYGVLGLVFLGVIQGLVSVVYSGDIGAGQGIFAQMSNLALFFAGPTAIFFLILGGYYYITSAGDDEKAKKGKSIVINTFIAVIILLASYTVLKDLADFKF